jgi:putative transposase
MPTTTLIRRTNAEGAKGQTRFDGFDDKILSLYARGMTVCEIQGHLAEPYGTEVSPDLISRVTDAVLR